MSEHSEPQPDVAVLHQRDDFYANAHPGPSDALLVVEVAETSAEIDREIKIPLFARAGIPEVWLVDIQAGIVEICRDPSPQGYRERQRFQRGQTLSPQGIPTARIPVEEILVQ